MSLTFKEEGHIYQSVDPSENIKWNSVTSVISKIKPKFDAPTQALKSSKNKKSKWYNIPPDKIQEIWKNETLRAITLGSFYHNQREQNLLSCETIQREGLNLPIIHPIIKDGIKYAPDQKVKDGIYPEHFIYLKSVGVCGQADRIEIVNNVLNVYDYKTNKEIKQESFVSWDGKRDTLLPPLSHLDNCNLVHYTLQLSIYMYMMLKHNPNLKPGKLTIEHIIFEKEGEDEFGYPITKYDSEGNPIIKEVVPYEVPYLKMEVITLFNWLKENNI